MSPELLSFASLMLAIVLAAMPLVFAALGELVAERAGVLNLGVEGMMVMGALGGFVAAIESGSALWGIGGGALAGCALALLFALLTQGLRANQVASGLGLTLLGLGLSALLGQSYVGHKPPAMPSVSLIGAGEMPVDLMVPLGLALVAIVALFLRRTRSGLVLRAVGEDHDAAHALGYKVRLTRVLAIAFGGAMAGLGGAYLSLVRVPQWTEGMTAGIGWIALAIVVFASWRPWRVLLGAWIFGGLTILQLNMQAMGIAVRAEYLAMIPYLVTILVLVLLSRGGRGSDAPAALGRAFDPRA